MFGSGVAVSAGPVDEKGDIQLQIGPAAEDILEVKLPNTSTWSMGIATTSVATQGHASRSIHVIKDAIDYLSGERGRMGAYQNRLEHAGRTLAVNHENYAGMESRIRDTDMADEITLYTKNHILQQSALSVLAQAHAVPERILELLR